MAKKQTDSPLLRYAFARVNTTLTARSRRTQSKLVSEKKRALTPRARICLLQEIEHVVKNHLCKRGFASPSHYAPPSFLHTSTSFHFVESQTSLLILHAVMIVAVIWTVIFSMPVSW